MILHAWGIVAGRLPHKHLADNHIRLADVTSRQDIWPSGQFFQNYVIAVKFLKTIDNTTNTH